jgi:hypothetical protein
MEECRFHQLWSTLLVQFKDWDLTVLPHFCPTRRFSAGNSEYPSITNLKLCSAHVFSTVFELVAVRTSNPAFSSTVRRTSARRGSRDTTRTLSFCVTRYLDALKQEGVFRRSFARSRAKQLPCSFLL